MNFAVVYRKQGTDDLLPGAVFLREKPSGGWAKDGSAATAARFHYACLARALVYRYREPPAEGYEPAEVVSLADRRHRVAAWKDASGTPADDTAEVGDAQG